jgi:hypothetical protein
MGGSSWKSTYDVELLLCESRYDVEGKRIVLVQVVKGELYA